MAPVPLIIRYTLYRYKGKSSHYESHLGHTLPLGPVTCQKLVFTMR